MVACALILLLDRPLPSFVVVASVLASRGDDNDDNNNNNNNKERYTGYLVVRVNPTPRPSVVKLH
jgi:hypothetical protein